MWSHVSWWNEFVLTKKSPRKKPYWSQDEKRREDKEWGWGGVEIAAGHFSNIYQGSSMWFTASPTVSPTSNTNPQQLWEERHWQTRTGRSQDTCPTRGHSTGTLQDGERQRSTTALTSWMTRREVRQIVGMAQRWQLKWQLTHSEGARHDGIREKKKTT